MKGIISDIFRAYDIRGVVDVDFDAEWVWALGLACGSYFLRRGHARAVVGHDCRHSSAGYQDALTQGLLAAGVDVVRLGMVPTPLFYYAVTTLRTAAGVMITASHNPPEYNGFKIWAGPTTIHGAEVRAIYEIMREQAGATPPPAGAAVVCDHDIAPAYLDELTASARPLQAPVKVVVDGGNGAGGLIAVELLRRVGAEVVPLYCEPDGSFPNHHPDPVVERNMADLMAAVPREGAHLGLGLDGDADRLGAVDEHGRMVYGDRLLAMFARDVLRERPGATVMGEVKCSHLLYRDIAAHGGKPVMGVTGHSVMKAAMLENGAALAGEMSGHVFFADRFYGFDDGIYTALRLVELLGQNPGKPFSTWLSDWPVTHSTPELRVDCPDHVKFQVVERCREVFAREYETITVDGARVLFPDGWGLVRASNTQPALVLRFEAETPERLREIRRIMEQSILHFVQTMA